MSDQSDQGEERAPTADKQGESKEGQDDRAGSRADHSPPPSRRNQRRSPSPDERNKRPTSPEERSYRRRRSPEDTRNNTRTSHRDSSSPETNKQRDRRYDRSPSPERPRRRYSDSPDEGQRRYARHDSSEDKPKERRYRRGGSPDAGRGRGRRGDSPEDVRGGRRRDESPEDGRGAGRYGKDDSPDRGYDRRPGGRYGRDNSPEDGRRGGRYDRDNSPEDGRRGGRYDRDSSPEDGKRGGRYGRDNSPEDGRRGGRYGRDNSPEDQRRRGRDGGYERSAGSGWGGSNRGHQDQKHSEFDAYSMIPCVKLEKPWRKNQTFTEKDEDRLRKEIASYVPYNNLVDKSRVLLVGPVGAGKSSIVNSIASALSGSVVFNAYVQNALGVSVTTNYRGYPVRTQDNKDVNVLLCDSMGLEPGNAGLNIDDIGDILDGKVKDGAKLDRTHERFSVGGKAAIKQSIQLVALVIPAGRVQGELMDPEIMEKMKAISKAAKTKDIVVVAVATNLDDDIFPNIQRDFTEMFMWEESRDLADLMAGKLGIGCNDVLFTVNYDTYDEPSREKNILALRCLRQMQKLCNLTLNCQQEHLVERIEKEKLQDEEELEAKKPLEELVRNPWANKISFYLKSIGNFKTGYINAPDVRILPLGQIGTGKSSFINSVQSMLEGELRQIVTVRNSEHTVTKKFLDIDFDMQDMRPNFIIQDVMGLEVQKDQGLHKRDIEHLIAGKIEPPYTFNPLGPIDRSNQYFNRDPEVRDRPHVLAVFVDASQQDQMSDSSAETLRDAVREAYEIDMRVAGILTKVDLLHKDIKKNIKAADEHRSVQDAIQWVHNKLGIGENDICYVKNYKEEQDVNENKDILIASVLKRLLSLGRDALDKMARDPNSGLQSEKPRKGRRESQRAVQDVQEKPDIAPRQQRGERDDMRGQDERDGGDRASKDRRNEAMKDDKRRQRPARQDNQKYPEGTEEELRAKTTRRRSQVDANYTERSSRKEFSSDEDLPREVDQEYRARQPQRRSDGYDDRSSSDPRADTRQDDIPKQSQPHFQQNGNTRPDPQQQPGPQFPPDMMSMLASMMGQFAQGQGQQPVYQQYQQAPPQAHAPPPPQAPPPPGPPPPVQAFASAAGTPPPQAPYTPVQPPVQAPPPPKPQPRAPPPMDLQAALQDALTKKFSNRCSEHED